MYWLPAAAFSKVSGGKTNKQTKNTEQNKEKARLQEGMKENRESLQFQKFASMVEVIASQPQIMKDKIEKYFE